MSVCNDRFERIKALYFCRVWNLCHLFIGSVFLAFSPFSKLEFCFETFICVGTNNRLYFSSAKEELIDIFFSNSHRPDTNLIAKSDILFNKFHHLFISWLIIKHDG